MRRHKLNPPAEDYPDYKGDDLGLIYTPSCSRFRLWSPPATQAELLFYENGEEDYPFKIIRLSKGVQGTWYTEIPGDWKGIFYTVKVYINHAWSLEIIDPYAKACGVNGKRAVIIDTKESDPEGWNEDFSPAFSERNLPTDAIIYELHVRDASIDEHSGIMHKGKFSGLAESNTKNDYGNSTGLDHLKELGVTHVHLLPIFDFNSVDEHPHTKNQYNWGYDPLHYNIPEGSYSTNPFDGITRIKELKQLIMKLHENGLRVIMDVVYNHTALAEKSNFHQLVPGYYYRHKEDGDFHDGTSCGNETASERPMMRKFIIDSLCYWLKEYHIDGFRFDLMGIHDIDTMNIISEKLHAFKPDILLYGEGWNGGHSPLPHDVRAIKQHAVHLNRIAVFSDDIRDAIKGSVFDRAEKGFISGNGHKTTILKHCIVGACAHPQVHHHHAYAAEPGDVVNYCECHDNYTLWDKLQLSNPNANTEDLIRMHLLALTITLTSQGIPFLHAGTEILRSKNFVENSYKSPDNINSIKWNDKQQHLNVFRYVQSLIRLRKEHPSFRMKDARQIASLILFDEYSADCTISYTIDGEEMNDRWKKIWVGLNGSDAEKKFRLPMGEWTEAITIRTDKYSYTDEITLGRFSSAILYQE